MIVATSNIIFYTIINRNLTKLSKDICRCKVSVIEKVLVMDWEC